jgi:hypothetical protein
MMSAQGMTAPETITVYQLLRSLNADWLAAFEGRLFGRDKLMLDMPLDSHVGEMCQRLVMTVEVMRTLGMERDDFATVLRASVDTMLVWYFG